MARFRNRAVQLVRVDDGRPLWAQTFDDKSTDIFSMEDSISEQVAHALAVKFGGEEQKELARHYTDNIEAYRDYVQGRYFEFQFTPGGLNQALREFDRAIELDPSYALAYAGLAEPTRRLPIGCCRRAKRYQRPNLPPARRLSSTTS